MSGVAFAQTQQTAQAQTAAEAVPEQVLVTGSLIHGAAAVGVPVLNLGVQDLTTTGSLKIGDLFRDIPSVVTYTASDATNDGGHQARAVRINIHGLDGARAPRSLMMIDGVRFPIQGDHLNLHDPSIIPALALDRLDVLVDGASATYGSDAVSGVVNIILKRGYDGAVTQLGFSGGESYQHYLASQLWGRTWDGGDITLTYEWYHDSPVVGTAHSKFTSDFTPWGLDNLIPLGSSAPGTVSSGSPVNTANAFKATTGNNCTNCFAIPQGTGGNFQSDLNSGLGPLAPSSGIGVLTWQAFATPANGGANGTRNEFDPLKIAWEAAAQERNAATITIDQRLMPGVSFYGEGFYSNRRVSQINPTSAKPTNTLILSSIAVPTANPWYPIGAPTNLRVNYNLGIEIPAHVFSGEIAARYQFGLNLDLPATWHGNIYYSRSYDNNIVTDHANANLAAVSAALGWTIPPSVATGTAPGIAAWTKPASVPYLNLFCDPRAWQCNSPLTLNYIRGIMDENEKYNITEEGANFDGPLFALPGGAVRAAVGGNYRSDNFSNVLLDNSGAPSLLFAPVTAFNPFQVWAGFAQLNVPVFGDNFSYPLLRRFEIEASWRHDHYSGDLKGSTSNPKVGFTWLLSEDAGFSIKGSWNTSFRLPEQGEYSATYVNNIQAFNLPANLSLPGNPIVVACGSGNTSPPAGSAAEALFAALGPGVCNKGLGGISAGGGPLPSLRPNGFNGGPFLGPETSVNYVIGGEFAPTAFLRGLDLEVTWYSIKINNVLNSFGASQTSFNDPNSRFSFVLPSDLANQPGGAGCATANANPAQCAPFEEMVLSVLGNPRNASAQPATQTLINWINDAGLFNHGGLKAQGIDWNASYDLDLGDYGAWNAGIAGTYYLHNFISSAGVPTVDSLNTSISSIGGIPIRGVETSPRMYYRGRLGWSDGAWSVTGFVDYVSHYFNTQSSPPNVNFLCNQMGGSLPGGTFPCAISNFTTLTPSQYLFDLSLGYDTGDMPENDYLKHLGITLVINNITGKHPAFQYAPGNGGHTPTAYDQAKTDQGRIFNLIITKTW